MTTPSDAAPQAPAPAPGEGRERRLHPWSWLFVLVIQLKQFVLPLLILLFAGRGDRNELYPLIGVGVLALVSVAQYFTYRYRVGAEGLTIRSGLFQRTVRHIPYDRVHNVALQQSLLHRLFRVAEVRLESAGGVLPEANMRVLSLADAHALERIVRMHAAGQARDATATGDAPSPPLLALDARELVRLGLISNRGMLVVAAAVGFVAQTDSKLFTEFARIVGGTLMGWGERLHLETAGFVVAALALMLAAVALLRVFSIVIAFLQFHGFTLRREGERLNVQRGLLTRLRGSLPRDRIQAFDLHEGLLHRWFGRRALQVDTMSADTAMEGTSLRHLAPLATPDAMDALVATLLPRASWPPAAWRPLHPAAWVRQWLPGAALWLLATGVLSWRFGAWGALALLGVPWAAYSARQWARRAGYAEAGGLVAVREGWLDVHWRFAETRKVQALRLSRSPLDKRFGMASVLLDTAGGSPGMNALRVRYLTEADARALYAALSQQMAATALAAPRRMRAAEGSVTRARNAATAAPAP